MGRFSREALGGDVVDQVDFMDVMDPMDMSA